MHYCMVVFFKMSVTVNWFLHHSGRIDVIGRTVTTVEHATEAVQKALRKV